MDRRLVAWGRAVKARSRAKHPVLWLFTDAVRLPDPLPAIAALPKNLCGVVFRHDGVPNRAALGRQVAQLCRGRKIPLTIAGDWRLAAALGAGQHLRGGAGPLHFVRRPITSSAHSVPELRRAARRGAVVFLSPVFATPSHPGARSLGAWRFAAMCRKHEALALGGVDGGNAQRLRAAGAGAIAALRQEGRPSFLSWHGC